MASIHRLGRRWRVMWRDGGRDSRQRSAMFDTKIQASQHAARIEAEQASAAPMLPGSIIDWPDLVARYCAAKSGTTQSHRDSLSRTVLRIAEEAKWRSTADVRVAALPQLTAHGRRCLRAVLSFAQDLCQPVDPAAVRHLRPAPVKARPKRLLTDDEVAKLQQAADATGPGNGALIHLIATYGHRSQSLLDLGPSAVDLKAKMLTVRVKSGDTIRHPILPATVARLRPLVKAGGSHLFISHLGKPWPSAQVFAAWWGHTPAKDAGPGAGILGLRRYAITRMLGLGLDAKTVASITGHRTVSLLLNTYAQTSEQRQKQAIQALQSATVLHGVAGKSRKSRKGA